MPPKRKLKAQASAAVAAISSSNSHSDDSYRDDDAVLDSIALFGALPTCAILSQVVGICTRVSMQIAMLNSASDGSLGSAHNIQHSLNCLSVAVIDLTALESILQDQLADINHMSVEDRRHR
jgi:hypothetical protein